MTDAPVKKSGRTFTPRDALLVAVVALVVLFAVLNTREVRVNWIIGTTSTPLIIVIAVSMLLGTGVGYLAARGKRKKQG